VHFDRRISGVAEAAALFGRIGAAPWEMHAFESKKSAFRRQDALQSEIFRDFVASKRSEGSKKRTK
jgi:hypothetical protein